MRSLPSLLSAVGFGLLATFAKLAYGEGVSVDTLLLLRFGIAGAILLLLAARAGAFSGLSRRAVAVGLAMGAIGYAAQASLYFAALTYTEASRVALVFCTYPLLVMVAASALGRERLSWQRLAALALALLGLTLVLGGAGAGTFNLPGVLLAGGSAVVYTAYILTGDRLASAIPPLAFSALVCTGAFASFTANLVLRTGVDLDVSARGWLWVLLLVAVSTVGAIILFFVGLRLVGPTISSLLAVVEPVVTVLAAALVFGESLSSVQVAGGVLVLVAVLVVQWARPGIERGEATSAELGLEKDFRQPREPGAEPPEELSLRP